ncbi:unnamed protein product [Schistosoma mattheei]|uniref:Transposase n=2 Tax=Schistosoma TaxID=6181 RepID=A0A183JC80_9TREM|nr:unnamed protein product [Schistosoma curassoni]VDP87909.1 unnamed protein product [Schistosoma mattheei]
MGLYSSITPKGRFGSPNSKPFVIAVLEYFNERLDLPPLLPETHRSNRPVN